MIRVLFSCNIDSLFFVGVSLSLLLDFSLLTSLLLVLGEGGREGGEAKKVGAQRV